LFNFSIINGPENRAKALYLGKYHWIIGMMLLWLTGRCFEKSATSSGANFVEAQAAVSGAGFGLKVGISLKEMRESNY
jgi:hypothetical protein